MITAEQIRAGRAAVGWSAEQLAKASGIVRRTVVAIEVSTGVPSSNAQTLQKIQSALEAEGIEFIGSPDDRPGIRIGKPPAP
ncbi:helix-turn-helix transcriptional regulator [Erythrobacter sp. AP23]|uniref:helix-turn-helix transcriptional regulator n=1 Tax=Erythrobacter sp. AP23 TaxID=499656 RepID=UPI0012ED6D61